jgi:hypothetical protein
MKSVDKTIIAGASCLSFQLRCQSCCLETKDLIDLFIYLTSCLLKITHTEFEAFMANTQLKVTVSDAGNMLVVSLLRTYLLNILHSRQTLNQQSIRNKTSHERKQLVSNPKVLAVCGM